MEGGLSSYPTQMYKQEDEIHDLDFMIGASEIRHKAKKQALILKHFETRWKREYLTALREKHRVNDKNYKEIKTGDVVLIHDDTARVNWRMAVIESVNKGTDGIIRFANIRTSTGRTNRPVARLYPLELTEDTTSTPRDGRIEQLTIARDTPVHQPTREAARRGQQVVKQWIASLHAALEDVSKT